MYGVQHVTYGFIHEPIRRIKCLDPQPVLRILYNRGIRSLGPHRKPMAMGICLPNGSLRQQYSQGTQIPLTTVVDVVTQIAAALHKVDPFILSHLHPLYWEAFRSPPHHQAVGMASQSLAFCLLVNVPML